MDSLFNRFKHLVKGTITGLDRIIFRGIIIVKNANDFSLKQIGCKLIYKNSCNIRKEDLVRDKQNELGIKKGLIGVWAFLESCLTFKSTFNPNSSFPILKNHLSMCRYLYFYYINPDYGLMSIRIQTWAPYNIQIALNGREWLRRMLDKQNCSYIVDGNKFLDIADYSLAQNLLNKQLSANWIELLNNFLPDAFPLFQQLFGNNLSYYWMTHQSEWARDYIFKNTESLNSIMDDLLYHSIITGTSDRILTYMGKPVFKNDQPHPLSNHELHSTVSKWYDGLRVKHILNKNSIKFYNQHNVLRLESTVNNPKTFKVHRFKQNNSDGDSKYFLPLRKSVADNNLLFKVSDNIINRFAEHLSTFYERTPIDKLFSTITSPILHKGKRFRALDITGKDKLLLQAISDPIFDLGSFSNKDLQKKLISTSWAKGKSGKKLASRISRNFRLLRSHGLIKKLPNQYKYSLTEITSALNISLGSSSNDLLKLAA